MRIIDLALKNLYQIFRDWKSALFLVIMPVAFTLMFGYVFGSSGDGEQDIRFPVGALNMDHAGKLSAELVRLLNTSDVIRPVEVEDADETELAQRVTDGDFVAAVIIPSGYSDKLLAGEAIALRVITEDNTNAGHVSRTEVAAMVTRLISAIQAARLTTEALATAEPNAYGDVTSRDAAFDAAFAQAAAEWNDPPFTVALFATGVPTEDEAGDDVYGDNSFNHSSVGMMAQFAIAGLIGAAEVVVAERKSRTLQRMLTTAMSKAQIITGHFLSMFVMVFLQLVLLVVFGQLLNVNYFSAPAATLLMLVAFAAFVAALGMLIGALAKTEDQVTIFSLLPMFILSGLGGAWIPLEFTPEAFQTVAYFTPVAWAIDGLKNIVVRGLGMGSVLQPAAILLGYALACMVAAVWWFRVD